MGTARLSVDLQPNGRTFSLDIECVGTIVYTVSTKLAGTPEGNHSPQEAKASAKRYAKQLCDALAVAVEKY